MEYVFFNSRLVLKHEDDECRSNVERSEIHSKAKSVQEVGLSHVFLGWSAELVGCGSEAVAEGIDHSAKDQAIDQKHLYPKPRLEGFLLYGLGCPIDSGKVDPVLTEVG